MSESASANRERPAPPTRPPTPALAVLPRWLWLWLAPATIVFEFVFHAFFPRAYRAWFGGETGVIEYLTNVFAISGCVLAIVLFRRRRAVTSPLFGPWMLFLALGCFVFAGEEMSWGMHLFGFEPPAAIAARNDQREFNLHNDPLLEPIFDFWARNALSWGALIGGVIMPIVRHRRGRRVPDFQSPSVWGWAIPTLLCLPTALTVIAVTLPPRTFGLMQVATPYPFPWNISWSESKEYDLALLILIYLMTLWRYLPGRAAGVAASTGCAIPAASEGTAKPSVPPERAPGAPYNSGRG